MRRVSHIAGMTLIEIMVVVAIIGLLSAVVGVSVMSRLRQGRAEATVSQIRMLETALKVFEMECGRYPTKAEGLMALVQRPSNCRAWKPILDRPDVPKDPWQQPFVYYEPGEHGQEVEVASKGADGTLGSGDDLVSWTIDGRVEEQG